MPSRDRAGDGLDGIFGPGKTAGGFFSGARLFTFWKEFSVANQICCDVWKGSVAKMSDDCFIDSSRCLIDKTGN